MFLKFAFLALLGLSLAIEPLLESSGFHCKSKLSMQLNHKLHGKPRDAPPPFDVQVLDEDGHKTEYYEPGKIYTVRLIGYQYYRGLLLQARLCDEHGFVIGSLRGGRFLETPDWLQYGIRLQECDMKYPLEDSVTHADDSRKFVTQIQWTTTRDVGNIQFMFTIASENDVYWEKWRPRGGFIQPVYSKQFPSEILRQVFYNEKYALKFLAGKFTSQETKMTTSKEGMPKLEEILVSTEKPEMPMETKEVLAKMQKPEFWTNHDGEVKVNKDGEKQDDVEQKHKKEGDEDTISEIVNSGEARVSEEITESEENEKIEEKPFVGDMALTNGTEEIETTTAIPDHESITHSTETSELSDITTTATVNSGEATIVPEEPESLKDEKPLTNDPAIEEAFSNDVIETKEILQTIAPKEIEFSTEKAEEATSENHGSTASLAVEEFVSDSTTVATIEIGATSKTVLETVDLASTVDTETTTAEAEATTVAESVISTEPSLSEETTTEETSSKTETINAIEATEATSQKSTSESTTVEMEEVETEKFENVTTAVIENNEKETTTAIETNETEGIMDLLTTSAITEAREDNETIEPMTVDEIQTEDQTTEASLADEETTQAETTMKNAEDEITTMQSEVEETTAIPTKGAVESSATLAPESTVESLTDETVTESTTEATTTEATMDEDTIVAEATTTEPSNEEEITSTAEPIAEAEAITNPEIMEAETSVDNELTDEMQETTEVSSTVEIRTTTGSETITTSNKEEKEAIESVTEDESSVIATNTETTTHLDENSTTTTTEEIVTHGAMEESMTESSTALRTEETTILEVETSTGAIESITKAIDEIATTQAIVEESSTIILNVTKVPPSHPKDVSRRRR